MTSQTIYAFRNSESFFCTDSQSTSSFIPWTYLSLGSIWDIKNFVCPSTVEKQILNYYKLLFLNSRNLGRRAFRITTSCNRKGDDWRRKCFSLCATEKKAFFVTVIYTQKQGYFLKSDVNLSGFTKYMLWFAFFLGLFFLNQ